MAPILLFGGAGTATADPSPFTIAVWPYPANLAEPIVEEYGYMTDVMRSYRGKEQRVQLRRHPVGAIEYSYLLPNLQEAQRANALLYRKQAKTWAAPLWHYATKPTADVAAGATTVSIVTADIPFTDPAELGPYALLWQSPTAFELVALNAIFPTLLELAAPTVDAWTAARTYVVPVRVSRLDGVPKVSWETSKLMGGRIRFEFDAWQGELSVPALTEDSVMFGGMILETELIP